MPDGLPQAARDGGTVGLSSCGNFLSSEMVHSPNGETLVLWLKGVDVLSTPGQSSHNIINNYSASNPRVTQNPLAVSDATNWPVITDRSATDQPRNEAPG